MSVRIHVDDREQAGEFDRLTTMGPVLGELERLLAVQFTAAQGAVHVITGSLRASEEIDSDYAAGRWIGQISFGGPSPGFPNDPVVYAVYEAARGGQHDFTVPITARSRDYGTAMREHLAGR
jgi:hypothetical protein